MKVFPTLFKKTSTGAIQTWRVTADGDKYWTDFGQQGCTITTSEPTLCIGKQTRTDEEQALFEAQALFDKKLKKDYVRTVAEAEVGGSSELIEGGILPMLAHKFSDHGDKLRYPCMVQAKLDGHRCIGMVDGLWSRTRKLITGVPHIEAAIQTLAKVAQAPVDGELYNHDYRNKFDELTHFIRQRVPADGHEVVQYHIYDVAISRMPFRERIALLRTYATNAAIGSKTYGGPLVLVETREVNNEDELMLAFEDFLAQGYEGAIARNADGLYVNKRSYDLLKIKQFQDSEYKIVGVAEGKGKLQGHGIFLCTTVKGTPDFGVVTAEQASAIIAANPGVFSAKMKGETTALKAFVDNYPVYRGRMLTVKYQGLTTKNSVPRFPVALRLREDA